MLPIKLTKESSDMFLDLVTKIVNISLENCVFGEQWKTAILQPFLKKINLELISCTYSLISNLSFFSKLVEKGALTQLYFHSE